VHSRKPDHVHTKSPRPYGEVNFAFKKLIQLSIDEGLAKKVGLPGPHIRLFSGGETATPSPTPG
jgi:hypothetical protein